MAGTTGERPDRDRQFGVDKGKVWYKIRLKTGMVIFMAKDFYRNSSGRHATLYVHLKTEWAGDNTCMKHSLLNIDRHKDRSEFCRRAFENFDVHTKEDYKLLELIRDFDGFCHDTWEAQWGDDGEARSACATESRMPEFLLKPYILKPGGTIIFAPGGRGKSYLGLIMGICIDSGYQQLWPTTQSKVMFVNLERPYQSVAQRIRRINIALHLRPQRELLVYQARGRNLTTIEEPLARNIEKHNIDLVILDSLSRTGYKNLQDDGPVNAAMNTLNRLCPSWLALAHTPRGDESHVFGSVMFDNAVDVNVRLKTSTDDDKLGLGLTVTKTNDIRRPKDMELFALGFEESGLTEIRKATVDEFPEITTDGEPDNLSLIKEHIHDNGPDTAKNIGKALDIKASTVRRILSTGKSVFAAGDKIGKEREYALRSRQPEEM